MAYASLQSLENNVWYSSRIPAAASEEKGVSFVRSVSVVRLTKGFKL